MEITRIIQSNPALLLQLSCLHLYLHLHHP